jgi:hypothetical protein
LPASVAFYPCCRDDLIEPLTLLRPYADEAVFCDSDGRLESRLRRLACASESGGPTALIRIGDARQVILTLSRINVLFYRRDSEGEGGSGLFVLGDSYLPLVLQRFPADGGLIITDGSNSRGSNFKRMVRPSGMTKHGWRFHRPPEQPPLLVQAGLHLIEVRRAADSP